MELLFGYIWTPGVFLRGCIVTPPKTLGQKLRIAFDYTVCFAFWGTALVIIGYLGIWKWFLVGYLVPSLMTGSMQTVRKFIEHLGLYGDTPDTATRTINDKSWFGRFISFTILNADIHGPHHVHAKIPQTHLPAALDLLTEEGTLTSTSIFPNYYQAAKAMLREVANPRIGKHWLASEPMKSSSNAPTALAG
jgi:fatty acid desaturase